MEIRKEVQAIIYNKFGNEIRTLLVKKLDLKNYSYRWRILKGGIENNETDLEALRREIKEEVGLVDFEIGNKINEYEFDYDGTLHQVCSYLVHIVVNSPMKIQTEEIIDAQWIPVSQAMALLFWKDEKDSISKIPTVF